MPELFTIETEHLTLVWSRRRAKPPPVVPEKAETPFSLAVQALRRGVEPVVRIPQSGETHLFEQTDYTLFVQSKRGEPVRVRHRDPVLVQGLQRSDEGRVVHGVINFGSQVGQSRFVVEAGSLAQFEFVVEVFPSKLDYRRDYEALREDVQEIAAELVLEYLRATYKPGWEAPSGAPSAVAWMLLLRHVVDDLEQAFAHADLGAHRGKGGVGVVANIREDRDHQARLLRDHRRHVQAPFDRPAREAPPHLDDA